MATRYISPFGDDGNSGTIGSPFFSLQTAFDLSAAGDTIYLRGGTYYYDTEQVLADLSGAPGNLINILAYPNEKPILDFLGYSTTNMKCGIKLDDVSYLYFKGFRITNVEQPAIPENGVYGMLLYNSVYECTIELVECDHVGGWGFALMIDVSDILFLNCDSHDNSDPYSDHNPDPGDPYGGADGWQMDLGGVTDITWRGCRAWANSDDGWDTRLCEGTLIWENCWAFWNGYIPETIGTTIANRVNGDDGTGGEWQHGGNGVGYKICGDGDGETKQLTNCLAFENYLSGFQNSPDSVAGPYCDTLFYNCASYSNWEGFDCEYDAPSEIRNSISYDNLTDWKYGTESDHDYNSDDIGAPSDADFVTVSSSGMAGPRQANGNLPVLNFLRLADGSQYINAGTDLDIATDCNGNAWDTTNPSLGVYEYGSVAGNVLVTNLTIASAGNVTTFSTDHGTLQFSVTSISPPDATDKTVTWSIYSGGTFASINSSGLMQALADGAVEVRATANDGSGVWDNFILSITGQTTIVPVANSNSNRSRKCNNYNGR